MLFTTAGPARMFPWAVADLPLLWPAPSLALGPVHGAADFTCSRVIAKNRECAGVPQGVARPTSLRQRFGGPPLLQRRRKTSRDAFGGARRRRSAARLAPSRRRRVGEPRRSSRGSCASEGGKASPSGEQDKQRDRRHDETSDFALQTCPSQHDPPHALTITSTVFALI